jgi:hypothetical protein
MLRAYEAPVADERFHRGTKRLHGFDLLQRVLWLQEVPAPLQVSIALDGPIQDAWQFRQEAICQSRIFSPEERLLKDEHNKAAHESA